MTAVDHGTTERDVAAHVTVLRNVYGARVDWYGKQDGVYRVGIGRRVLTFNDLHQVRDWAIACTRHVSMHEETETSTFWAYACQNGANWHSMHALGQSVVYVAI